jgi:hypothetical protein
VQEALPHAAENDVYLQVELLKELLSYVDQAGSQGALADRDTSPAHSTSSLESDGGSMPEEPPGRQVKLFTKRNIYFFMYRRPFLCTFHVAVDVLIVPHKGRPVWMGGGGGRGASM